MQHLSFSMHPTQLELPDLGCSIDMLDMLDMLDVQMLLSAGMGLDPRVQGNEPERAAPQSVVAFLIPQEAFTNAVRHAAPTSVEAH